MCSAYVVESAGGGHLTGSLAVYDRAQDFLGDFQAWSVDDVLAMETFLVSVDVSWMMRLAMMNWGLESGIATMGAPLSGMICWFICFRQYAKDECFFVLHGIVFLKRGAKRPLFLYGERSMSEKNIMNVRGRLLCNAHGV